MGHPEETFVKSCGLYTWDGVKRIVIPCGDHVSITKLSNPVNYNCYLFSVVDHIDVFGISLTLFINNIMNVETSQNSSQNGGNISRRFQPYATDQTVGAIFDIVEPGKLPLHNVNGMLFAPGTHNEVHYGVSKHTILEPPHGKCDESTKSQHYHFDGTTYQYTKDACTIDCLSGHIMRECGCIPFVDNYIMQEANATMKYCGDLSALAAARSVAGTQEVTKEMLKEIDKVLDNYRCMEEWTSVWENAEECWSGRCKYRCNYYQYTATTHSISWPQVISYRVIQAMSICWSNLNRPRSIESLEHIHIRYRFNLLTLMLLC